MDHVRQALETMYSGAGQEAKKEATVFLERFQKSGEAWSICHELLASDGPVQYKVFAAQTLRAKTTYDLSQLDSASVAQLRNSLLELVAKYGNDRLVSVQLCLALAQMCLQDLGWENPMADVVSVLQGTPALMLQFLKVLPEELLDANKTPLTDEEFSRRTEMLISRNTEHVLVLLKNVAEQSGLEALVLDCLNSWIKECPVELLLAVDAFVALIFRLLTEESTFETAVECLCSILRETRDVDNEQLVEALYEQVLGLHKYFAEHPDRLEDPDTVEALTKLYVEAGELWHVLIAKNPTHFKPLVEILLSCTDYGADLDVAKYTFYFWYELKQMLTLPRFEASRAELSDIYLRLIHVIIGHLRYPAGSGDDSFNGDKEHEDKFKEFRYEMGDVLKDCCAVAGLQKALNVPFSQLERLLHEQNPPWQLLEAPLFAMRVMAKEVSNSEKTILPVIMQMLMQLPEQRRVRYATTLVLGRYSQWTAHHPEYLETQLDYIIRAFDGQPDPDVVSATCQALMYFCQDCTQHLVPHVQQLHLLYSQVHAQLQGKAALDMVSGLACVVLELPRDQQYATAELFLQPTLAALGNLAAAPSASGNAPDAIHDALEAVTIFLQQLRTADYDALDYPIATLFVEKIWPVLQRLLGKFGSVLHVSESVVRTLKTAIQSCSVFLEPVLPDIAHVLHEGFQATSFGCYLWVTGVILREFSDEAVSPNIQSAVYGLGVEQSAQFFQHLSAGTIDLSQVPDVVEDYFNMTSEMLMFYPNKTITNADLMRLVFHAGSLSLQQCNEYRPLVSCVRFFVDFVLWGLDFPPISFFDEDPKHIQAAVRLFLAETGPQLAHVTLHTVVFKMKNDPEVNDLLVKLVTVGPQPDSVRWLQEAALSLENVTSQEVEKLVSTVATATQSKDTRRIRVAIKDFVSWYLRKNASRLA